MGKLHVETPAISSPSLTKLCGREVYLKLENLQPSGSFKLRGIGHLCEEARAAGCTEVVSSSGGNAGLAAAYAARSLQMSCTVFTPRSTPAMVVDKLRAEGADVQIVGKNWNEANEVAVERAKRPGCCFVHPYEHPTTWTGHSTLVTELQRQLPERPAAVLLSVGGGGLANGVIEGLHRVGWDDVPVVAAETEGADCFSKALEAGKPVSLPDITSLAKSLGALQVSSRLFESAQTRPVFSVVVSDRQAVEACTRLAEDHRLLVEPACGAALAPLYYGLLPAEVAARPGPLAVVVCGGSGVTPQMLIQWQQMTAA
ncbi:serine dehydratase-like [Amphibalanus amphitrite]|uniref:serine dehydratase-like n=1 Tax=Amphibalanus amphitrite TaxID=1232801 RepID=UPI001C8FC71C|nr:serine dehydratase-like [Amphibalanus amphitrite]XP_043188141.1 serine dehydratase-like [Amphibalanus amphitrite]XP_043188224.1 serine dehydratase-like [Amphibalanus amphitrite]